MAETFSQGNVPYWTNTERQLEAKILNAIVGGGGGGGGGVTCGTSDPVAAPAVACTLHYRTDDGSLWMWNGSAWVALIAA